MAERLRAEVERGIGAAAGFRVLSWAGGMASFQTTRNLPLPCWSLGTQSLAAKGTDTPTVWRKSGNYGIAWEGVFASGETRLSSSRLIRSSGVKRKRLSERCSPMNPYRLPGSTGIEPGRDCGSEKSRRGQEG